LVVVETQQNLKVIDKLLKLLNIWIFIWWDW